ncbi:hypothetical protein [Sulfurospirillum arcachonense]|uniref:hypothetical protein n=1 Tax=Sulfurospirillum arcachonense TaxID=57666 RepID=UPI000468FA1E|nr:hypothetical protein [Sulfurospirillum arcachonense]
MIYKIILVISIIISVYFFYLTKVDPDFNRLIHMFYEPNDLKVPVLYKDIKKIEDIDGTYEILNCKYVPEIYVLGLGLKYEFLTNSWHENNIEPDGGYNIKMKLTIKDNKNKIIYSNILNEFSGIYGGNFGLKYDEIFTLDSFKLVHCKNLNMKIEFIDSNIKNIPEDLLYLFVMVNTNK